MIMRHYLETILANHPSVREVCVRAMEPGRNPWEYCAYIVLIRDTPSDRYDFLADNADFLEGLGVAWEIVLEIPKAIRCSAVAEASSLPPVLITV